MQSCNHDEPCGSSIKQRRGRSFIEGKEKVGRAIKFSLLCFMIEAGRASHSGLPTSLEMSFLLINFHNLLRYILVLTILFLCF